MKKRQIWIGKSVKVTQSIFYFKNYAFQVQSNRNGHNLIALVSSSATDATPTVQPIRLQYDSVLSGWRETRRFPVVAGFRFGHLADLIDQPAGEILF